ncbi:chemotaxis protein CheA [Geotalea daltonii]|uniref:chemotaxis protein CheA n=1 Tax=Geotalea daltonii TaxID=1203471 RepID=UPI00031B06DC|nr:chemotaxis protein CheA [Geotalea daltonii]
MVNNTVDLSVLLADFVEDTTGHLDAVENALLELEKQYGRGVTDEALVTQILGNLHTIKGNSGMMGLGSIQQLVHKLEAAFKQVLERNIHLTNGFFEAIFAALNNIRESLAKLVENPAYQADFSDITMLVECVSSGAVEKEGFIATADKKEDSSYISQKSSTLKVNFEKLDDLLNLVGELVIRRTGLLALESRIREINDKSLVEAFTESSQLIGDTAAQLREAIMKARMLPVKVVFQRFNRLVRDLCQCHGKEVNLVFIGEDTELDKTVIDEIGEPLLHLIRNAVDHGLENPEVRRRSGKPAKGILTLRARHENNHMVISVEDDGSGISPERLRNAAVSKGLIDSRQARALSDHEALQLMFLPGFSTKEEVTETSGRGIGLDVVKNIVASFNGMIDIESAMGVGTTFTIKLPLTLAIITSLMVEVSGDTYAIPLSGVLESIKVDRGDIHEVADGEVIQLRDRLLPLVRVGSFFGLPQLKQEETEYVVVVGSGERRGGLVVDRLIGQQEIVIKAMDDYLGALPGIAGGTILGNGKIALIFDIASLIGKAKGGRIDAGK